MKKRSPRAVSCAPSANEDEEQRGIEAQYEEHIRDGGQSIGAVVEAMKEYYGQTVLCRQTGRMAVLGFLSPTRRRLPAALYLHYDGKRWHLQHDEDFQQDWREAQLVVKEAAGDKLENPRNS